MNTRRVNSAAEVILAALAQNRTAAGIALALESAGFLVTPGVDEQARPAPYTATPEAHAQMRAAMSRHFAGQTEVPSPDAPQVCKACGSAPEDWCPDCAACQDGCFGGNDGNPCKHPNARWARRDEDVTPQVTKLRALLAGQRLAGDDPHGLHHDYRLGRDLPTAGA